MGTYEVLLGVDSSEPRACAQSNAIVDLPVTPDTIHASLLYVFAEPHDLEPRQIGGVRVAADCLEEAEIETTLLTRVGDPAEEIIQLASEVEANLICLGEWDRSAIDEVLHGSVTRKVVHQSSRPTLICYATPE
jgi:nucleotide-binding universal stress UspA family protein